jgi:hypothetical protein
VSANDQPADRAMDREAEAYQAAVNEAIPELARDHAVRQAEVRYQKAAESVWEGIPEDTDAVNAYAMARERMQSAQREFDATMAEIERRDNPQADPHRRAVTHRAAEDAALQIEVRKEGGTSLEDIAAWHADLSSRMVNMARTPDGHLYAQTFADRGGALLDVLQDRAGDTTGAWRSTQEQSDRQTVTPHRNVEAGRTEQPPVAEAVSSAGSAFSHRLTAEPARTAEQRLPWARQLAVRKPGRQPDREAGR